MGDCSGTLEPEEFADAMTALGTKCTATEVTDLLGITAAGKAARVTYPDFLTLFQHTDGEDLETQGEAAWDELFAKGDKMDAGRVKEFCAKIDLNVTDEE